MRTNEKTPPAVGEDDGPSAAGAGAGEAAFDPILLELKLVPPRIRARAGGEIVALRIAQSGRLHVTFARRADAERMRGDICLLGQLAAAVRDVLLQLGGASGHEDTPGVEICFETEDGDIECFPVD